MIAAVVLAAADIDRFYQAASTVSFTLLGLWWVVVQLKYKGEEGDPRRQRHAYAIALFFLLPGVMGMLSAINSDLSALWRLSFGVTATLGLLEIVLYRISGDVYTRGAVALRAFGFVLYVLIAAFALRPTLAGDLSLGLAPREAEAILIGLLIVVGVHLAWFGLTEGDETAGA
jgi:hypothetical protein